jgi:hypothetical protein
MKTVTKIAANSDTYARIARLPINESQRTKALAKLRRAQSIVDNTAWFVNLIKHLLALSAEKSRVKRECAA